MASKQRVIAHQDDYILLIVNGEQRHGMPLGQVLNTRLKFLYPPQLVDSIVKAGYWEEWQGPQPDLAALLAAVERITPAPPARAGAKHNRPGDHPIGGYAPAWHSAEEMMAGPTIQRLLKDGIYSISNDPNADPVHGDPYGYALAEEQGFTRPPQVVSKEELDAYVAAGEVELFRGCGHRERIEAMRTGEYYMGDGMYGDGTYTAINNRSNNGREVAEGYAGEPTAIGRMTLKAGARVGEYADLENESIQANQQAVNAMAEYMDHPRPPGLPSEELNRIEAEIDRLANASYMYNNVGSYAIIHGYDAVHVSGPEYMLVLNRTALRIQQEDG